MSYKRFLQNFKKDKISSLDGWTIENFHRLYELMEDNNLRVGDYSIYVGRILSYFNIIPIALILKIDNCIFFEEFTPISLCNCIYKIVAKVITRYCKNSVFSEKIGFLEDRWIQEAISLD